MYARHIKGGIAMRYVGESNKHIDNLLKNHSICAACGRRFGGIVIKSTDNILCEDCLKAIN